MSIGTSRRGRHGGASSGAFGGTPSGGTPRSEGAFGASSSVRSVSIFSLPTPRGSMVSLGAVSTASKVSWDEGSVNTVTTTDTMELPAFIGSGIPDSEEEGIGNVGRARGGESGEGDSRGGIRGEDDDDDDEEVFQVADERDLEAVDLCVSDWSWHGKRSIWRGHGQNRVYTLLRKVRVFRKRKCGV